MDANAGAELQILSFNSVSDIMTGNVASSGFSSLNVTVGYSTTGLTWDGNQFQMLFETDADSIGGSELFLLAYDSIFDILNGNVASNSVSSIDVEAGFTTTGLAAVPEPTTIAALALGASALLRRRKGRRS